MRMKTRGCKYS